MTKIYYDFEASGIYFNSKVLEKGTFICNWSPAPMQTIMKYRSAYTQAAEDVEKLQG